MSTQRRESKGRRGARGRIFLLERLEDRRLLAAVTEGFTGPSLSGLISLAFHGKDTAQAAIKTMLSALQTQLTNGPLADLNSNTVNGNVNAGNIFVTEVQSLVASYNQNVDQQLLPHFTHIDNMLKLQGQQVVANLVSLNQQNTVGLISSGNLPTQAGAAINTLTGGPIFSLNTPVRAYVTATQTFETNLGVLANSLSTTAPTPPGQLTLPKVSTTIQAEAEAYRASMDAGLQVTHSNLSSTVNAAVTTLESSVIAIATASPTPSNLTAESDIHAAIATFDSAILDTTGLFGLNGPVNRVNSELGYVPHNLTGKQAATTISVSGTATGTGTATLTATLNSATGTGLGGKVVSFTLDGAFAGTAVTNSSGVATLTGVPQSDTTGTDTGGVVASFAGDSTNLLSQNSGNLVVSTASTTTTLASSTNPSVSGQSVTFTATVAAVSPGSGTPTGTVNFLDNGTQIGTGTLTAGMATFTTTSLSVATHPITAVYVASTNFSTSTSSVVSQVVNQASSTTTLASSTNPSVSGQSVTFMATVAAASPGSGTPTGTVNFLDGTTVIGSDIALTAGVATFSTSTLTVSGSPHSITAKYSGDTNFTTSTSSAVSQVVNQASTTTGLVSSLNPSTSGTLVTFTATVAATAPGSGTPTGTVNFLDGTTMIGSDIALNSSGVATFSTSTLTAAGSPHSIKAVYSGNTNFTTSTSSVVSQVVS